MQKAPLFKNVESTNDKVNHYRSKIPTPIFNTPHLTFKKDDQGLIREVETIALPGTSFKEIRRVSETMIQVETAEYRSDTPLYVDTRFLEEGDGEERKRVLPSSDELLEWLKSCVGIRYFWGGNWEDGIPQMLDFFPFLQTHNQDDAICRGLDCSGFLYRATDGLTPRNTGQLIHFGYEVNDIRPLDLIVWVGHILIVLDENTVIESRKGDGVVVSDYKKRYEEILKLNKQLYFRRWHPDFLQTT
jgi:cell wall-associated NlpC family hydrolase